MNKKQKTYENLYEILSDSEPELSGESLLNTNKEENEFNLIFSQEDNESLITTPTTSITTTNTTTTNTTNTILENESNSSNTSRETSWVWEFFSKEYNDKQEIITYICIICKNRYKPSNTAGTLARHLTTKHNNKIGKIQSTLDKFAPKPYAKSEKRYQQLTNTIVDFIVCCQLPFAIVDNPYFTTMLNTFDGRYQVPCRQTIKSEIMNNYDIMKKRILQELSQTKKLSITCDIWSSITMQSYLGITVHFIDHNWKLQHFLLDLLPFPGSHSAVRIQQLILQVLDDVKITKKLLGITTDNAQSMIAAAKELKEKLKNQELNQEFIHQRCAAHILNIAVQHGLQLSDPIIKKVRNFIVKIRQLTKFNDSIKTICQLEKVSELKPDLDVETRWNSTYLMLNKFHRMRNILDILVAKNRELGIFYIQDNEWQNIENIIELLKPIFIATEILSSSTYPTISDIRLIFIGLLRHLESFIQKQNNLEDCLMANSISFKLGEYWKNIEESTTISTLLDPRSKTKTFQDYNKRNEVISSLRNLISLYKNNNQLENTRVNIQLQENKRSYFEFLLTDQTPEERPTDDEITRYISAPIDINTNPLEWWQRFEKDFPVLSQIALCYLSIQGSSVPSEQAFSIASNTITKIRSNLKPETARAVMCLKSWIQQVRDQKECDKFEESYFLEY